LPKKLAIFLGVSKGYITTVTEETTNNTRLMAVVDMVLADAPLRRADMTAAIVQSLQC